MNNILKLFVCVFVAMGLNVCRAEDENAPDDADVEVYEDVEDEAEADTDDTDVATSTVSVRMDCKTIKAKIDELKATGDDADELSRLQLQYRRSCVVRASGLRASYRGGALTIAAASADAAKSKAMASMPSIKIAPQSVENVAPVASQTPATPTAPAAPVTNTPATATETVVEISDAQKELCERLVDAIKNAADDVRDTLQGTYDEYCKTNVVAPEAVIKTTLLVLGPVETEEPKTETEEEKYARIAANLDAGLCPDGDAPNKFGCCKGEVFKDMGSLEFACCPESGGGECFPPMK